MGEKQITITVKYYKELLKAKNYMEELRAFARLKSPELFTDRTPIKTSVPPAARRDLVTVQQAALIAGKSTSTVRSWIRDGYISKYRSGDAPNSLVKIDRQELLTKLTEEK